MFPTSPIFRDASATAQDTLSPPLNLDHHSGDDDRSDANRLLEPAEQAPVIENNPRCFAAFTVLKDMRSFGRSLQSSLYSVLEQEAEDNVNLTAFSIGERISLVGPLVHDVENQINAICPSWSVTPS
jgi:hypothetical protein